MRYRRVYIKGGSYFITATLEDRNQTLLTDHIEQLKFAITTTRKNHPFHINAIVILPDHFHLIMTLPDNDAAYSLRISLIKRYFIQGLRFNRE